MRQRATRDQKLLDSGGVPPKEMTNLQHELRVAARRQCDLEDQELELMERREAAGAALAAAQSGHEKATADRERAVQQRDDALADIADATGRHEAARAASPGSCRRRCSPSTTGSARRPAPPARRCSRRGSARAAGSS